MEQGITGERRQSLLLGKVLLRLLSRLRLLLQRSTPPKPPTAPPTPQDNSWQN